MWALEKVLKPRGRKKKIKIQSWRLWGDIWLECICESFGVSRVSKELHRNAAGFITATSSVFINVTASVYVLKKTANSLETHIFVDFCHCCFKQGIFVCALKKNRSICVKIPKYICEFLCVHLSILRRS